MNKPRGIQNTCACMQGAGRLSEQWCKGQSPGTMSASVANALEQQKFVIGRSRTGGCGAELVGDGVVRWCTRKQHWKVRLAFRGRLRKSEDR